MYNALTIDLEEWYHPELVRPHVALEETMAQVEAATRPILDLLERHKVRATFFVVGEVAQCTPDLIREITERGHEISCHGMSHRPLHALGPEGFRAELERFAEVMRAIGLEGVAGYRAPTFSLDNETRWAVPILAEFGYVYDASIFPLRTPLYGVPDCPPTPYRLGGEDVTRPDPQGLLWEFPMSVGRLGCWKVPICGGSYLRLAPFFAVRALLARLNARGWPFVIYLHPWETYPRTPRRPELAWWERIVTYANAEGTLAKLERLLQSFNLAPMHDVLARWRW